MPETFPPSADQLWERHKADQRLRLLDLCEDVATKAEAETGRLRDAYARRYKQLVGVLPEQRGEFRHSLENLCNVTVEELVAGFS